MVRLWLDEALCSMMKMHASIVARCVFWLQVSLVKPKSPTLLLAICKLCIICKSYKPNINRISYLVYNNALFLFSMVTNIMSLRIASWNTNSITIRLAHVIDVMNLYNLDVLGIQETKVADNNFPIEALNDAGLHVFFNGQKSYNGTAYVSRMPLAATRHHLPGMQTDYQRRFLQAELNDILLINCYVPNGKAVGDEKYDYKLRWLDALIVHLKNLQQSQRPILLMGDFNIAPDDRDVYDAEAWKNNILCSPAERQRLQAIKDLGFSDTFRLFNEQDNNFSWWDYREGGFQKNKGHRIDLLLSNQFLTPRCTESIIEKAPRAWERPSDHTPVIATFTDK